MKDYKLSIGSPVYQETYNYAKKRIMKIVRDECRKHLIVRFSARYTKLKEAQETLNDIIDHFIALTGCTEVTDLAKISWGEPATYDEKKQIFNGAFCIPKDFDGLMKQKNFISAACKEKEKELNYCPVIDNREWLKLEELRKQECLKIFGEPRPY